MADKKEQYGFNDHWYRGHHILPVLGDRRMEGDRWYVQAWFDEHTCYSQEHSASRKFRTLAEAREYIDEMIAKDTRFRAWVAEQERLYG